MSVALKTHDLRGAEAFYKRWGPDVFAFCRLFLGDERRAEVVCSKAFLDFYRESTELPTPGEVPSRLVGLAFKAMQPCGVEPSSNMNQKSLESCILRFDCQQRAVFIMRNVLRMTWPSVASASGLAVEAAKEFWLRGMLKVHDLLPRDLFEH